uniref:Uncharacterized protein n=1 Tax=Glossina pallidipes TaxID=7398 RepID=A0A1A9Z0E6_GLOPL
MEWFGRFKNDCKFVGSKFETNIGLSFSNPSECKLMHDVSLSIFFKGTWPGFEAILISNLLLCCLCNLGAEIGYESDYICKIFKILLHGNIDGCISFSQAKAVESSHQAIKPSAKI